MRRYASGLLIAIAFGWTMFAANGAEPAPPQPVRRSQPAELDINTPRARLRPLFDAPIRNTSICRGGDGRWYATGNYDADGDNDFQNNEGIWLWQSDDFSNWQGIGQVWSIARDATAPQSAWQREYRVNPDNPRGPLVRGIVSPRIHYLNGTYWLTYSMNHQGTGLLRSTTGKPEGPYRDVGRITEQGTDASLFEDDDGSVYWVVGRGFIARMKPDMSGLAEAPRLLRPTFFPPLPHAGHTMRATQAPRYLGQAGAFLFKAEGRYWLTAAAVRDRLGVGCYDTFVAGSDNVYGPYDEPKLMIAHGGQTTVFEGPQGRLYATFAGRDSRAVFRDRPAAVPLIFRSERLYAQTPSPPFPRKQFGLVTEFGPWDRMSPITPYHIRDLQFSVAPDGYAYLTGSGTDNQYAGRIMLFRSKDMRKWEPVEVQFDFLSIPGVTEEDRAARFDDPKMRTSLGAKYMDSEIYFAEGTFHIFTSLYHGPKRRDGADAWSGSMWLRSTTGKPEGPYEYVDRSRAQISAFQDDDGQWYVFFNGTLMEWDPKSDKLDGKTYRLLNDMGTLFTKGDVATNLAKIHGKYVIFATAWCGGTYGENYRVHGTYDWVYWQSDALLGPYEMPRRAYAMPHAGHSCPPQKGPDGRWYGLIFGNDDTGPWGNYPGVMVYDVRLDPDDTIRIELKDELP